MIAKAFKFVVALVVLVALAVGGFLFYRSQNAASVDTWIGKQLVGIVSSYIVPTIEFDTVKYNAPYGVSLRNVTLTAPDGTRVVKVAALDVELAEIPSIGKPIVIKNVLLTGGDVNLIASKDGGFKGLVPFSKVSAVDATKASANGKEAIAKVEEKIDPNFRLSNTIRLEKVSFKDVALAYDASDGNPPMKIEGLSLDLAVSPDAKDPGWYAIDTAFGRAPQAQFVVKGRLNIDTLTADLAQTTMTAELGPDTLSSLPGQLQTLLKEHDARGKMVANISGILPVKDINAADVKANVTITALNVAGGEFRLPIDNLAINATLKSGTLEFDQTANLIKGAVISRGTLQLASTDKPLQATWTARNLDLRELLRAQKSGEPPKLAGILNSQGSATSSLNDPKGKLAGNGDLEIKDGRLILLPGLSDLAEKLGLAGSLLGNTDVNHALTATYDLGPAGIMLKDSELTTPVIAARAKGKIGFDQQLDLAVNAGPLEKMQGLLGKAGKVGKLLGDLTKVTDKLVTYRVTGPANKPELSVAPLGFEIK
ncbi:MAG: hypothetical protein SFY96_09705 [Planctomycetota bacterium]|nr:hypothetical protein [Planctomycetota bacterium]